MDNRRDLTPEQIDRYWDDRVAGGAGRVDSDASDFAGIIDALHAADRRSRPSRAFRDQLRSSLMEAAGTGNPPASFGSRSRQSLDGVAHDERATRVHYSRQTVEPEDQAQSSRFRRAWWVNHALELAAILVIIVAAAAVAIYVTGRGGDESFHPGATGEETPEVAPIPDASGLYRALTFEQAQEITPFGLIEPSYVPDGYTLAGVMVNPPPVGDIFQATLIYQHTDVPGRRFELWQMNSHIQIGDGGAGAATVEIEIDGLPVTVITRTDGQGDEMVVYVWHQDRLGLQLVAMTDIGDDSPGREPEHAVAASDLEQFARAIIEGRHSDDAPGGLASNDDSPATGPGIDVSRDATPTPDDAEPVDMMSLSIYLVRDERIGMARRSVPRTAQVGTAAMRELLVGVTDLEADAGLSSAIPDGTQILGLTIQDGIATVDLSSQFESGGGSLSMQLRVAQVVYTLTQFPTVDAVQFWIDGQAVEALGGEGLMVDRPLGRLDFEDVTPLIFVESPAPGDTISSPLHIWGTANTFEAEFQIEIIDSAGELVYAHFVMATSGSGERGTFDEVIEFDATADGPGWVIVYQPSMEDGSRMNEVVIPVVIELEPDE